MLGLLGASTASAANECRLKYRTSSSPAYATETMDGGTSRTLTRNGVVEALNDGRNDLELTLELSGL
jgi:hypothetical protein